MVLVSDKLNNNIGISQTIFSDREGHEARRMGLEAMPLDQHIEGGHGEGGTGSVSCNLAFVLHLCRFLNQEDLMEREAMVQNP